MESAQNPKLFSRTIWMLPFALVLIMWFSHWFNLVFSLNYEKWGIYPRNLSGLRGVLFSPFIHSSPSHLYQNTIPIFVLSTALRFFYPKVFWKVLIYGTLLSGLGTWLIGKPAYHIGMSGLIYVLASFMFFKGIFSGYFRLIALSLGIVFVYGSLIWYVFPIKDGMSWEGHLSGLITGFLLAKWLHIPKPKKKVYDWEKPEYNEETDPFMRQFDEEGNFIELPKEVQTEQIDNASTKTIKIHYNFKPKKKE
ncbi:MAG: rhomboid family intramembrane serine protease [Flavobacteriaceae bacterium]|nr:rhomboid family intramembrane serine protease [Flavobacteriaceae bacterium]